MTAVFTVSAPEQAARDVGLEVADRESDIWAPGRQKVWEAEVRSLVRPLVRTRVTVAFLATWPLVIAFILIAGRLSEVVPDGSWAQRTVSLTTALVFIAAIVFTVARSNPTRAERRRLCEIALSATRARIAGRMLTEPRFSPPAARPEGVTNREAELLVAEWMRHIGYHDAQVTRFSRDGGIDVVAEDAIAQVKNYSSQVGVGAIRELHGVNVADRSGRVALLFASAGFTRGAVDFAEQTGVGLFIFGSKTGRLTPVGRVATRIFRGSNVE